MIQLSEVIMEVKEVREVKGEVKRGS